ncbi:MAG: beta-ketoacyl synthase N-terminal-like domain-containing protein, partial [Muribaculaceae bacterium]|nr:beta-ketoacyl synthase N-terminal-like domain-containing protein [Muribaculaceae bacterium]
MELKRVVVTGMGAITPIGNDVETTWANALKGVSGAAPITHFDASLFKTKFACEVKGFNGADHFDRKKLRQLDLYAQYAMVAARQAVKDSGLEDDADLNKNRVGVIVAAGIGGLHTFEEEAGYYAINEANGPKYNPFFIPKMIADIASGHISMDYGYHGPNYGVVSACASSNNAIIDAFNLIRLGKADAMVTGGAEAAIYPAGVGGFNSMHALSTRNDSPETASRPFSKSRDGF